MVVVPSNESRNVGRKTGLGYIIMNSILNRPASSRIPRSIDSNFRPIDVVHKWKFPLVSIDGICKTIIARR